MITDWQNRRLTLIATTGIVLAFAAMDYATPEVLNAHQRPDSEWLVAVFIGVCIAQVTLIAAWAVFAPGNIVVRLSWALLLGLVMWYILTCSEVCLHPSSRLNDTVNLGISILIGVVLLQLPLWIAKRALRYRINRPGEEPVPAAEDRLQFQLKHMLIGTTIFAMALSPLRFILPKGESQEYRPEWELFVFLAIGICVNLVTTLPCLWGGFVSNTRAVGFGFAWLLYALLVTGLEFAAVNAIIFRRANDEFWLYYLVNFSQGAIVFAVMRGYRALGYRLQRVPRKIPPLDDLNETC